MAMKLHVPNRAKAGSTAACSTLPIHWTRVGKSLASSQALDGSFLPSPHSESQHSTIYVV